MKGTALNLPKTHKKTPATQDVTFDFRLKLRTFPMKWSKFEIVSIRKRLVYIISSGARSVEFWSQAEWTLVIGSNTLGVNLIVVYVLGENHDGRSN